MNSCIGLITKSFAWPPFTFPAESNVTTTAEVEV